MITLSGIYKSFLFDCTSYSRISFILNKFSSVSAPLEECAQKVIKVAIVGVPNTGKSTLINSLISRRVCPTSNKVHTTKKLSQAVCINRDTQIIFLDTPGIVSESEKKRYNLKDVMKAAYEGLKHADIIGAMHDVSNPKTRNSLHRCIRDLLFDHQHIPSFLILNKIDLIKSKRKLLDMVRILGNNQMAGQPIIKTAKPLTEAAKFRGFDGFSDAFMISALEADGIESILEYLVRNAKPGSWPYSQDYWTDQNTQSLVEESVRAKFLDYLPQEIPYKLNIQLEFLEESEDKVVAAVTVKCPSERIRQLIAGAGEGRLRQIQDSCRFDLMNAFQKRVALTVSLTVKAGE